MEANSLLAKPELQDSYPDDEDFDDHFATLSHKPRRSTWTKLRAWILPAIVSLQSVLLLVLALRTFQRDESRPESLGYYPASSAVHYYETTFQPEDIFMSRHEQLPSEETDQAWKDLQAPTDGLIQASAATGFNMDALPETIHSKFDTSLAVYGLEVFHQLHCLDRLRKSYYPEYYFPNETAKHITHHREHCIEHLRQSIMCSGDIAMDRWHWDTEDQVSYLVTTEVPHVCRDFGMLSDWVKQFRFQDEVWKGTGNDEEDEKR